MDAIQQSKLLFRTCHSYEAVIIQIQMHLSIINSKVDKLIHSVDLVQLLSQVATVFS